MFRAWTKAAVLSHHSFVVAILLKSSYRTMATSASYSRYAIHNNDNTPSLAVVTGGSRGIGRSIAEKIATFPFIDHVIVVSRSIQQTSGNNNPKLTAIAANIGEEQGRKLVVDKVDELSQDGTKPLRYLIHSAGTIDPIKSILDVTEEELTMAMNVNVVAPTLLTTALYHHLASNAAKSAGRVLHVSSGAAHGPPPVGWAAYGISKAAFYQSFKTLDQEFEHLGGKVRVGSFKPGVVDTDMQAVIRKAPVSALPLSSKFHSLKENTAVAAETTTTVAITGARPPPSGALDTPDNVAYFAEWLLLGTTDDEFSNRTNPSEYDIRDASLFSKWIPPENLPPDAS